MGMRFSHLTMTKRIQIEAYLKAGKKPVEIAARLGVHHTTIYREIKRSTYEHLNSDYTTETRYSPDVAHQRYRDSLKAKGPCLKLGNDYELAEFLAQKISVDNYSPAAALGAIAGTKRHFKTHICVNTLYSYIHKDVFGNQLTAAMLPNGGMRKPPRRRGTISRAPAGESIERRPAVVDTRSTFGHWEMDTVVSCTGTKNALLVLTERMTRREIIVPIRDKTTASVVLALNALERKIGSLFPKIFRTITCDNGVEFSDCTGMERKRRGKGQRTHIYYCHPYSSYERGSNENQNRMIRRHFPKGTDFGTVTPQYVSYVENWINNYPRKLFGFQCSEQRFREQIAALLVS